MFKRIISRAPWLGLILAAAGFSYALATSGTSADGRATQAKGASGTTPRNPLAFTNPYVTGLSLRDLGDAAIGSTITRRIAARGGIPPRRFTSDRGITLQSGALEFKGAVALADAIAALPAAFSPSASTAVVQLDGILTGQVGGPFPLPNTAANTPMKFDVTVTDSRNLVSPLQLTDTFEVTMVDSTAFKFAQSALHDGVAYQEYFEKIEVIAGNAPYNFTVASITVTDPVTGIAAPFTSLPDDLGLFLNPKNGRLVGRPLVAGKYSLLVNCTDKHGAQALARNKNGVGQVITFNVEQGTRLRSALFATKISIKGSTKTAGKDSIQYNALVDLAGTSLSKLNNSDVTLTIGNYTSPSVTIQGGKGSTPLGAVPSMSVNLSFTGTLAITIKDESFGTAGSIVTNADLVNSLKVLPAMIEIGNTFAESELLRYSVKARSDLFDLEYKFGPGNLGGGFLISQVTGKDDSSSAVDADSWRVSFITLPHKDQKFDQIATATVGIGTDFTDTIAVGLRNTAIFSSEKRDPKAANVVKLGLDNKSGRGALTTGPLPKTSSQTNTATAIPAALNANGKQARFPLIITFNRADAKQTEVFGAEGARAIFPKGNTWTNKDLSK